MKKSIIWLSLIILSTVVFTSCKKKCNCVHTSPSTGEQTVISKIEKNDPCPGGYTPSPEMYHKECP